MNPKVTYVHWVIMMCQCRFINYNEWSTLVSDVDGREGCMCRGMGAGAPWEISVPSAKFCHEPKITLKHEVY